ncbi:hypothetical protein BDY21DRAFT_291128 [Lineolata rhizophorae]|uniref:Uncharacterized protein n=1 Tax=Lineolata rhizophorae TaxID=578093 RepID=A0A6A6NSW7_9PEZI|nr:hypothetical protein BDY21DRAFT_291128 [Lineolata rhizophorae]
METRPPALEKLCRVVVYARVTDIEGDSLTRPVTLGYDVCAQLHLRDLHNQITFEGYDAVHCLPHFDSPKYIKIYILFDFGVTGSLSKDELAQLPHYVFLATRHNGAWSVNKFIHEHELTSPIHQRTQDYTWGGKVEQDILEEERLLQQTEFSFQAVSGDVSPLPHKQNFLGLSRAS